MFEWLLKLWRAIPKIEEPDYGTGALLDDRTTEAKLDDVYFTEVVGLGGANPVKWEEKTRNNWRTFPIRNQGKGSSCMANAYVKMLGVLAEQRDGKFVEYSAAHVYQRRMNKPKPGMWMYDVFRIGSKGVALEAMVPSEKLLDSEIDRITLEPHEVAIAEIFSVDDAPVYIPGGDFDTVASVIQTTGKAVMSLFYFTLDEWAQLIPGVHDVKLKADDSRAFRHGVAMVDVFTINGVPVIRAEDSAHFGNQSERLITRDFFKYRNIANGYTMRFKFDAGKQLDSKPFFDGSVMSLQKCLRWENFFPSNVSFTNIIGPITREALVKFQKKYGIEPALGVFGPETTAKITELYG